MNIIIIHHTQSQWFKVQLATDLEFNDFHTSKGKPPKSMLKISGSLFSFHNCALPSQLRRCHGAKSRQKHVKQSTWFDSILLWKIKSWNRNMEVDGRWFVLFNWVTFRFNVLIFQGVCCVSHWWFFTTHLENVFVKLDQVPQIGGINKTCFKPPPRYIYIYIIFQVISKEIFLFETDRSHRIFLAPRPTHSKPYEATPMAISSFSAHGRAACLVRSTEFTVDLSTIHSLDKHIRKVGPITSYKWSYGALLSPTE